MMFALPTVLAARLDWGFGNPNKTAALIATLMIAAWILPFLHRRLFWLALLLTAGLGVCLMQTTSRGGIVAAAAGLAVLLVRAPRPWPRPRVLGAVAAVWIVAVAASWLPTLQRFNKGLSGQDLSISQRLELWLAAPRMMVDAPDGWGFGNAADAFHQWYQPLDQTQTFLSLINSHLTWLVEIGWPGRFAYVFGWLAVLALCWPGKAGPQKAAWLIVPWAVWLVFAGAAWFSSVAESPGLWALPAVGLVCVLAARWHAGRWLRLRTWAAVALGSGAALGAFFLLGSLPHAQPSLRLSGLRIVLGSDADPQVWVVANPGTFGKEYGRTLRGYLQRPEAGSKWSRGVSVAFVSSADGLSAAEVKEKTLVAGGTLTAAELTRLRAVAPGCAKLVLLNPAFYPPDLEARLPFPFKVEVVAGEFSQTAAPAWADALKQPVQNVEGAGDFLPRWPELVLANHPITP